MTSPHHYLARSSMPVSARALFDWHARPGAFARLQPPYQNVELVERTGGLEVGARTVLRMRVGPVPQTWVAVHTACEDGVMFADTQESGPFKRFDQVHRMVPDGEARSFLEDDIRYQLPVGALGDLFGGGFAQHTLEALFAYRHGLLAADLERHRVYADAPRLHVLVTGASGLIGSALVPFLTTGGHRVTTRAHGELGAPFPEDVDAVIHLAGASISTRWTAAAKEEIRRSREEGTRALVTAMLAAKVKPRVLLSGSAVGYYGSRGDETLTEASAPGDDFLAGVCKAWEAATRPAAEAGIRVVTLRTGIVLSPRGGALGQMLLPARSGVAGRIGPGTQHLPWISIEDTVGALHFALQTESLEGPVNLAAPGVVTNATFMKTLGHVLHRPSLLPLPAFAVRAAFGEMGGALLLGSQKVKPTALERAGFPFLHPTLEGALRFVLGKNVLANAVQQ